MRYELGVKQESLGVGTDTMLLEVGMGRCSALLSWQLGELAANWNRRGPSVLALLISCRHKMKEELTCCRGQRCQWR